MGTNLIAIIGAGYVGLQSALGFAKAKQPVIAFDIDKDRIDNLKHHIDLNREAVNFDSLPIKFTHFLDDISPANYYIITVPTPVNKDKKPCLDLVIAAAEEIGPYLKSNNTVICESTVYPGTTEEVILPILESKSGLKAGVDFYLGYSSERINPSDEIHRFDNVTKVYAGLNEPSAEKLKNLYNLAIQAPLFKTPSIKVAEASKLVENIQRDVNIALMNECMQIMDKMSIRMSDVLDAAATKWNFIPYKPGFVGGHCIAVDPYYLIERAKVYGVDPPLMTTARVINDGMVDFIYNKAKTYLLNRTNAKVSILGLTYKENIPDSRNSLAIHLYHRFRDSGTDVSATDPYILPKMIDFPLVPLSELSEQDLFIICVPHKQFKAINWERLLTNKGGVIDLPNLLKDQLVRMGDRYYWSP